MSINVDTFEPAVFAISDALDEQLQALYLFGSAVTRYYNPAVSDVNLLIVPTGGVHLNDVRERLLPVWPRIRSLVRTPPAVASAAALTRHMQLFPAFAAHLQNEAHVYGTPVPAEPAIVDPLSELARLSTESLHASAALVPGLLPEELAEPAGRRLHRLARQLANRPLTEVQSPAALFGVIQHILQRRLQSLQGKAAETPSTDSNVCGLYYETTRAIFLIPAMDSSLLPGMDWPQIAASLPTNRYQAVNVATAAQLRLSVSLDDPLDFCLHRFEHAWGEHPLTGVEPARHVIYRALARIASRLLIFDLPQAHIAAHTNNAVHKVVHDLQNRILNLHLQVELLRRFLGYPFAAPSMTLPGRGVPLATRIDAIIRRLDWWAGYYTDAQSESA